MLESQLVDILNGYITLYSYPLTHINLSQNSIGVSVLFSIPNSKRLNMISSKLGNYGSSMGCMMQYKQKKFKENVGRKHYN